MSIMLDAALGYAKRGWPVFPLHTPTSDGHCDCLAGAHCKDQGKHPRTPHGLNDATTSEVTIRRWWEIWPNANIGLATGSLSGTVVLDVDPRHGGDETLAKFEAEHGELPRTLEAKTGGGGRHIFFKHPGGRVKSVNGLAPGIDVKADGGYVVVEPSLHVSGRRYAWDVGFHLNDTPLATAPMLGGVAVEAAPVPAAPVTGDISGGSRNSTLASLAGTMRRRGISEAAILAALLEENSTRCSPSLEEEEVRKIAASIARYAPAKATNGDHPPMNGSPVEELQKPGWPDPLGSEAFHGLAGEVVRTLEPETEADPAALLVQFLVAFGNFIGRNPYFMVERDRHYTNLFAVLVGQSSKARKGTFLGRIRDLFRRIEPPMGGQVDLGAWETNRVMSGLSSGEGLIWQCRDQIQKVERNKKTCITEVTITDPGIDDKRILVVEPEFGRTLRVMQRDGSTLSAILRTSWDTGILRALTKNSPAQATGAHVSIVAHVTSDELRNTLAEVDSANGFANRFIFFAVKRSKCLPEGGSSGEEEILETLASKIADAARDASKVGQMFRDTEAREEWIRTYPALSEGKSGLLGALTARAEAQVLRLSLLYALSDGSPIVKLAHQRAAMALWAYSESSCSWIWGKLMEDATSTKVYEALAGTPAGLTKTDIHALFSRNKTAAEINMALEILQRQGVAIVVKDSATGGRPKELWSVVQAR